MSIHPLLITDTLLIRLKESLKNFHCDMLATCLIFQKIPYLKNSSHKLYNLIKENLYIL